MTTPQPLSRREKHFLDTSVARPLLLASDKYREYLHAQFARNSRYISIYVQMEIRRSFIRAVVAFYAILQLPMIDSVDAALSLWSNEFKQARLKAVIQLIAQILNTHSIDINEPTDKQKASNAIAHYIIRFEAKVRHSSKDPGQDTTHCTRALVPLPFYADDLSRGLEEFAEQFDDTEYCRDNCNIDYVILRRYLKQVQELITIAQDTPESKETRGFLAVANQLKTVLENGPAACSCHRCEKIGDAVIALETPRQMLLEHLDNSFNQLCPPLHQRHRQHESEIAFYKASA